MWEACLGAGFACGGVSVIVIEVKVIIQGQGNPKITSRSSQEHTYCGSRAIRGGQMFQDIAKILCRYPYMSTKIVV